MIGRPRKSPKVNGPLNKQIQNRMKSLGITEWREFARRFHIGESTLHSVLAGRQSPTGSWIKPSIETLSNLAVALEMPVHEVLYALMPELPGASDFTANSEQVTASEIKPFNGYFNDLIDATMTRLGIKKLDEFAVQAGIARGTLYHLIRGRISPAGTAVKPSIDTLLALSRITRTPIAELIQRLVPDEEVITEIKAG